MESILSFFNLDKLIKKKDQPVQKPPKPDEESVQPEAVVIKIPIKKHEIKNNYTGIKNAARGYMDRKKLLALKIVKGLNQRFEGDLSKRVSEKARNVESKLETFVSGFPLPDYVTVYSHPAYIFNNNTIYSGQWNDKGEKHGKGIEVCADGSKYEGHFKYNKRFWNGRLITAEGDVYQGEWAKGRIYRGFLQRIDGTKVTCTFKNGLLHGEGIEESDGWYYKGNYKYGLRHGKGMMCLKNWDFYEGDFKNNNKEGKGIFIWYDGKKYKGDWKDDKMHGSGIFTWPDGRKYQGTFQNGLMHGFGVLNWPDGKVYIGEWKFGEQDGRGKLFNCNDKSILPWFGTWKSGQRIEQITFQIGKK
ncbi:unnamed protein product [Blepharisma stoltei]|uniref:MORN repeat protein n=1 Tax=Blepharisma stoltei TaxID=1481888 RepID=A0AAU9I746_9CILI|nr:unnamed protein product [Blepharisma stoltei]